MRRAQEGHARSEQHVARANDILVNLLAHREAPQLAVPRAVRDAHEVLRDVRAVAIAELADSLVRDLIHLVRDRHGPSALLATLDGAGSAPKRLRLRVEPVRRDAARTPHARGGPLDDALGQHPHRRRGSQRRRPGRLDRWRDFPWRLGGRQFGAGTGGNVTYKGKDMQNAHKGMQLSGMEFIDVISDIMMVLKQHNIDEESRKDVLYILYSFKDQIIAQ